MSITETVPVPTHLNAGVVGARQQTMLALLGNPRCGYDATCQPITNVTLRALVVTQDVGPFRVTGLRPAVEDLKRVLADIGREEPRVYAALGSAGMLCARLIRGATSGISNHSWGTAIDLTLNGTLDCRGDGRVCVGLARIAPIFNAHGWFWGAGFGIEDAMHFEVGDAKIRRWHADGVFGGQPRRAPEPVLSLGDRGPEVLALQRCLNERGCDLRLDGVFGRDTHAALVAWQAERGLAPDGVVGRLTRVALGLACPDTGQGAARF